MAVDILDFGNSNQCMPSPNIFLQGSPDVYAAALRELAVQDPTATTQGAGKHYWQENGVTVLEANLPSPLKASLLATASKVLPLADSNRPHVQNENQSVRSLTLGCYTRRGFGVTLASEQEEWRELLMAAHAAATRQPKSIQQAYLAITITEGAVSAHRDQYNQGDTNLLVVGDYVGGGLVVEQRTLNVQNAWTHFNPQREHAVEPYTGFRRSFAFYVPKFTERLTREDWDKLLRLGFPVQQYLCQLQSSIPPGLGGKKIRLGRKERQKKREHLCAISAQALGGPRQQTKDEPCQPCAQRSCKASQA
eukprot:1391502-Amphidinium_carterae.1